jgi:hypothetical protein
MAQTRLIATNSLGFLAYHNKMSELNDGSRRAREAQPRPEICYKIYDSF